MKIIERQNYFVLDDDMDRIDTNCSMTRPMFKDMVEICDGDGEPFCFVRWDMAYELCSILNATKNIE